MKHAATLFVFLTGAWILWSGLSWPWGEHFVPLVAAMGVLSVVLVVFIAWRMDVVDHEGAPLQLTTLRTLAYLPWLGLEIVKANLVVARRILDPRLPISPHMIEVSSSQATEIGRVVYANSITLTPGTVSVNVNEDSIAVHALTREAAEGVETGEMDRRVTRLEAAG